MISCLRMLESGALVSWNFKRIVNALRIRAYNLVNSREGYLALEIFTPSEVVTHG